MILRCTTNVKSVCSNHDPSTPRVRPDWDHSVPIQEYPLSTKCNFYGSIFGGNDLMHFRHHLIVNDLNTQWCIIGLHRSNYITSTQSTNGWRTEKDLDMASNIEFSHRYWAYVYMPLNDLWTLQFGNDTQICVFF